MNDSIAKLAFLLPVYIARGEFHFLKNYTKEINEFSCDKLKKYQLLKIKYLFDNVLIKYVYYRKILKEIGYTPSSDMAECFSNMPFLTKDITRREMPDPGIFSSLFLDHRSTSGSSGIPLFFYKDRKATGFMDSVQSNAYFWHKIGVAEPQGRFWGMPIGWKGKVAQLKDLLRNRIRFSAFDLSNDAKFAYYRKLIQFRPTYLYGYPSLILDFARFLNNENLALDTLLLKAVIGTGEYVYPEEKQELERLLGIPYISEYGCSEIGVIGIDCPHGNMHLMSSNVLVEIVDAEGLSLPDGNEGEIVVTELNTCFFPFIRYRLGDRGMLTGKACPCGRHLPLLKISAGRKDDYILTPDGKKVYDAILAYTLKKGVVQFKCVQKRPDHIVIYVVTDNDFNKLLEKKYIAQLRDSLSPKMKIEFIKVERIDRERSGKLRYFRSEIT